MLWFVWSTDVKSSDEKETERERHRERESERVRERECLKDGMRHLDDTGCFTLAIRWSLTVLGAAARHTIRIGSGTLMWMPASSALMGRSILRSSMAVVMSTRDTVMTTGTHHSSTGSTTLKMLAGLVQGEALHPQIEFLVAARAVRCYFYITFLFTVSV